MRDDHKSAIAGERHLKNGSRVAVIEHHKEMHNEARSRQTECKGGASGEPVDKEVDLAPSKQLLCSRTLHLSSKFHKQPSNGGCGTETESALFTRTHTHTTEPYAQSNRELCSKRRKI